MSARKIGLLLLILGLGSALETAWVVRSHVDVGPEGCRVLGGKFYGPSYSFEETASQAAPAGARVEVRNAFGRVQVRVGEPGEVKLLLRKVVFRPSESEAREFAGRIAAQMESAGGVVRVTTNREQVGRDDRVGFETHLDLMVPPGTPVLVGNEHGEVDVSDVAAASVDSSFDGVRVERVKGPADVKSRHGDVTVSDVEGALTLNARHGDVELKNVGGRAVVETRHGSVRASALGGLELDHAYGDVEVDDVRGDLRVKGEHAGVKVEGVTGNATVESTFNDVEIVRVGGEARVKVEHGEVKVREVKGSVVAETTHNDVELADVEGPVEVKVDHGGVRGERLQKGVKVKASGNDVELEGVQGAVDVDTDRGSVHVAYRGPLTEPITIRSQRGGIRLEVPAGSRFELEAEARRGDVEVEVAGLTLTRTDKRRAHGSVGSGGILVKLSADGDVTVEERTATASGEL